MSWFPTLDWRATPQQHEGWPFSELSLHSEKCRDPVGELVTQVLEAPVPEERPRLCQVLSGHHLDLIPLLTFSKNVTLKG